MSRKAAEISPEELWRLFVEKAKARSESDDFREFSRYDLQDIDKIGDDLKKVEFDFENCEFEHFREFDHWEGMLGYRLLYPLSYIGVMAGGDWEIPIYFIIYLDQDGKTLRAYIPKDGNVWNHDTKRAFGNDDDDDTDFLRKWLKQNRPDLADDEDEYLGERADEFMFDKERIRQDIANRIEVMGKDGKNWKPAEFLDV